MKKPWLIGGLLLGLLGCAPASVKPSIATTTSTSQPSKGFSNQAVFEAVWFAEQQYVRGNYLPAAQLYDQLALLYSDSFKIEQFAIQAAFKVNRREIAQRNLVRLLDKMEAETSAHASVALLQSLLLIAIAFDLPDEASRYFAHLEPLIKGSKQYLLLDAIDKNLQSVVGDPFLKFIQSKSGPLWIDHVYVEALVRRKQPEALLQLLSELVKRHKNHPFFHYEFAKQLYLFEHHDAAYQAAQPIQDSRIEQHQYLLFLIELSLDLNEAAEQRVQRLAANVSYESNAYHRLALYHLDAREPGKALLALQRIKASHLFFEKAFWLAEIYWNQSNPSQSLKWLQVLAAEPERLSAIQMAQVSQLLYRLAGKSEALSLLDSGGVLYESSDVIYYQRALILLNEKNYVAAEQNLVKVLHWNDQHAEAYNTLGYLLTNHFDRHEEALPLIQKALDLSPESPHILDSMGWVLFHLGQLEASEQFLRQALSFGYDAEVAGHLSEVLLVSGQVDEANSIWDTLVMRFPESSIVREMRARLSME